MPRPRPARRRLLTAGVHLHRPASRGIRVADHHLHLDRGRSVHGQHKRRLKRQLLNPPAPGRIPAATAISTNAVPGTSTVPAIAWSASHG